MKRKLIALTLTLGCFFAANGQQDQHFSMFTESPVYMNPAVAGFTPGDLQLFTNYRLQWSTVSDNPYRTISASADWRLFDNGGNRMGNGGLIFIMIWLVQQIIKQMLLHYLLIMRFKLGKKVSYLLVYSPHFISEVSKKMTLLGTINGTGVEFDQAVNNNELILSQNFSVSRFDIAAGIYWDTYLNRNARIKLGLAGHHLTKQRINFTNEDSKLYRKLNFHGQGEFKSERTGVTFLPAFATFFQGPNKELTVGSNFKFLLKGASRTTSYFEEVTISLGAYFRVKDAIIANVIFDIAGFSIGAAYDLNVSNLNAATKGVGSMEFFLKYRIQFGTRSLSNNRVH